MFVWRVATRKQWTPTLGIVASATSDRGLARPDAYRDAVHLRRPFADQDCADRAMVQYRATTAPGAGEPVRAAVVSVSAVRTNLRWATCRAGRCRDLSSSAAAVVGVLMRRGRSSPQLMLGWVRRPAATPRRRREAGDRPPTAPQAAVHRQPLTIGAMRCRYSRRVDRASVSRHGTMRPSNPHRRPCRARISTPAASRGECV